VARIMTKATVATKRNSGRSFGPLLRLFLLGALSVAFMGGLLLAGCDEGGPQSSVPSTTHPGSSAPLTTPAGARAVEFSSKDGLTLRGTLFGSGSSGVLLAHMYPADQTSWWGIAERLAQEGYLVLTFDFRGYGESEGGRDIARIDRDVLGGVSCLQVNGAGHLVLVGASMGGTACLVAADALQPLSSVRLAGVATLSAPVEFKGLSAAQAVPRLAVPLLFIAAEGDVGAEGARQLNELAGDNAQLRILAGSEHGTQLLEGPHKDTVYQLLTDFLHRNLGDQ